MHGTTTREDIFNCVYDLLQKYNLPQSKLTSVATDGAPSMTGKTNGFVAVLRKKLSEISDGSNIHHTHCIIHQEVLCTKVIKMENVLTPIKKFINFIRSRGLNQRQFSLFLTELVQVHVWKYLSLFSLMKGNKSPIRSRITDVHLGSVLKLITANKISPEVGKMMSCGIEQTRLDIGIESVVEKM
ncbi:hypothetical protein LAZ67_8003618 [Cordylochernes scorpioides]|uniref:Uncharacterized protein n=1 Tax=Cordylochernes scorpioides TaxID=51811 RepID=A0ABY6KTP0_9ARAC|nr:hypothetical protein LAZ67_8003618 [Cordylochernes scorpioides]